MFLVLDLKANNSLQHLSLIENELTILDLSSNTNLIGLLASKNKLKNIDLKAHSLLQYLILGENELTTLDVSSNAKLYWLDVNNNKLTSLNIKNGLAKKILPQALILIAMTTIL